ncbi:MAG: hypothetical protein IJB80_05285 [Clostridia bacterium]|nr:hypothetical protein [Clostridia bacterium]
MKKVICIFVLILCFSGCSGKYDGWKEIEISDLGRIKIPQGWTCHIEDNKIYFTDEGVEELNQDTVHLAGYIIDEGNTDIAHRLFDEKARRVGLVTSEVFSNDTYRGKHHYIINGKKCEKAYIDLGVAEQDKEISMIVWDDSVTYEDVGKMAQSFKRNMGGE